MNALLSRALVILLAFPGFAALAQEGLDITNRDVTDPLLKISSSTHLLPESDDKIIIGRRDEEHKPPLYKKALGKFNVFMLEPHSRTSPATMDFSAITTQSKGRLTIQARNDPRGDFALKISKSGQPVYEKSIGNDTWQSFTIPFDHEPVILEARANGWSFEFAFIAYTFAK